MAAESVFSMSTRGYVQGDNALTTLYVNNGSYKLLMRGDSADARMPGAALLEGDLSSAEQSKLGEVYLESKKYGTFVPAPLIDSFVTSFYKSGIPVVRLDAAVSMLPKDGALQVTVVFKNSGREEVCLKNPATWEGTYNPIAENSWIVVSAQRMDSPQKESVRTDFFGGTAMTNAHRYPGESLCVPSMQERETTFRLFPRQRVLKGKYLIGASIVVSEVFSPADFAGPLEMSTSNQMIEFPRDYPSTPAEIRAFAAYLKAHPQE
ncbi:hypothetical protein [Paraburkholderia acidisoli]|uniref:Uncharacterized protein n=1 Tax=Paraburkholderia acidisoli TaxID=2571748 RepID=A0A7Z2JHR9_9BURK|nr:hypothetical protein [Paraburkholderia acidisoli]QGZ64373.1 hypothetical protein FAZ98_21880 [Paraburkholderia acidisoli]